MTFPQNASPADMRFAAALVCAVTHSGRSQRSICHDTDIKLRTLQRWLAAESFPTAAEWSNIINACGITPMTCLMIADHLPLDRLRPASAIYFGGLFQEVAVIFAEVERAGEIDLHPRAAKRDAASLAAIWQITHQQQQTIFDARRGDKDD